MEEAAALSDNSNSDEILLIDLRSPETNMQIKFEILTENSSGCNSNGYVLSVMSLKAVSKILNKMFFKFKNLQKGTNLKKTFENSSKRITFSQM